MNPSRRKLLRIGGAALAAIPLIAHAARNEKVRESVKYQDKPEGDKSCANCAMFIPGKSPTDLGGCALFPGDTEVSPNGYCVAWAKKP